MGMIYEVEGLDGWSFEVRRESVIIMPPYPTLILSDGRMSESVELSNEDILLLQHVVNEAVAKIREVSNGSYK